MTRILASVTQTVKCVVEEDILHANRSRACDRGIEYLVGRDARTDTLGIVGGGPSAVEALGHPGPLMAINGAYGWLRDHGRLAQWFLGTDPQPELVDFLHDGDVSCTEYLLADFCDPAVFDVMADRQVKLLRLMHPGYGRDVGIEIPGGPSAMTRAPVVAAYLGFREVVLYGADCCFTDRQHIYDAPGHYEERLGSVHLGGRKFLTTPQLFAQGRYLSEMVPALAERGMNVSVAGDNLTTALLDWASSQKVELEQRK